MQDAASNFRPLRYRQCWALTNLGNPQSIHRTRVDAKRAAQNMLDMPWEECKAFMEVRKVTLVEGWQ
jgi:hypothetical protein